LAEQKQTVTKPFYFHPTVLALLRIWETKVPVFTFHMCEMIHFMF